MIILGIDPGVAVMGFGVIERSKRKKQKAKMKLVDYGCIRTSVELELPQRLLLLRKELRRLIRSYKPSVMAAERLFFNTNAKTAIAVGQAGGVAMLVAAEAKIPVFEYTALEAKLELTGYGRAKKSEVQNRVGDLLKLEAPPRPLHAADALAIAICHARKSSR